MKVKVYLLIRPGKDGQPLPVLNLTVGEDTYHVFHGDPVPDWPPGAATERTTDIEIDEQPNAAGQAATTLATAYVPESDPVAEVSGEPAPTAPPGVAEVERIFGGRTPAYTISDSTNAMIDLENAEADEVKLVYDRFAMERDAARWKAVEIVLDCITAVERHQMDESQFFGAVAETFESATEIK